MPPFIRNLYMDRWDLDERLLPYLRQAGFSCLANLPKEIKFDRNLAKALLKFYNKESETFEIGGNNYMISLEDILCITSLRVDGEAVAPKSENWPKLCLELLGEYPPRRNDNRTNVLALNWLSEKFMDVPENPSEDRLKICARAYILYAIGSLLMPKPKKTTDVSLVYLSLLEDFSVTNKYAWGSAVLAELVDYFNKYDANDRLIGSSFLLTIWAYEHFANMALSSPQERRVPLMVCWLHHVNTFNQKALSKESKDYYEKLKNMDPSKMNWEPYNDVEDALLKEEAKLKKSVVTLISIEKYTWHRPDKCVVQFGVPNSQRKIPPLELPPSKSKRGPPAPNYDWAEELKVPKELWKDRWRLLIDLEDRDSVQLDDVQQGPESLTLLSSKADNVPGPETPRLHSNKYIECEAKDELLLELMEHNVELMEHKAKLMEHNAKLIEDCRKKDKKIEELYSQRKLLHNELVDLKGNIRVLCRCRPLNQGEIANGATSVVNFDSSQEEVFVDSSSKRFKFDHVFKLEDSQEAVFAQIKPVVTSVLDGYNVCIFAYGQTGTGKTYTMNGSPQNRGVICRTLEELFRVSEERVADITYEISINMLEIHKDQIRDLLVENSNQPSKKLEIRLTAEGTEEVSGLVECCVCGTAEVLKLVDCGNQAGSVGATRANEHSSRSHCLLRVTVNGENLTNGQKTRSHLWLVDLAGSERVKNLGLEKERFEEARFINKSLSALADVIYALESKNPHIPYRNSKLTHMLKSSLGGDCKTLMFVQISPSAADLAETLSSLEFASRVQGVESGPARKQADLAELLKYKKMVQDLEKQLAGERRTRIRLEPRDYGAASSQASGLPPLKQVTEETRGEKKPPLGRSKPGPWQHKRENFLSPPSPIPTRKVTSTPVSFPLLSGLKKKSTTTTAIRSSSRFMGSPSTQAGTSETTPTAMRSSSKFMGSPSTQAGTSRPRHPTDVTRQRK